MQLRLRTPHEYWYSEPLVFSKLSKSGLYMIKHHISREVENGTVNGIPMPLGGRKKCWGIGVMLSTTAPMQTWTKKVNESIGVMRRTTTSMPKGKRSTT